MLLISRLAMDSLGASRYREYFFASAIVSLAPDGTFRKAITTAFLGIERWATTRLPVGFPSARVRAASLFGARLVGEIIGGGARLRWLEQAPPHSHWFLLCPLSTVCALTPPGSCWRKRLGRGGRGAALLRVRVQQPLGT